MSFFSFLGHMFDPVLGPLLQFPPIVVIGIVSVVVVLFSTLAYKFTTNQKEMKAIRDDISRMR